MKYVKGLRIDVENVEGDIRFPQVLDDMNPLAALDVVSDWMNALMGKQCVLHQLYFMELCEPYFSEKRTFEELYDVYLRVINYMDLDVPLGYAKELCQQSYTERMKLVK